MHKENNQVDTKNLSSVLNENAVTKVLRDMRVRHMVNRRSFLGGLGVAGAAAVTAPFIAACGSSTSAAASGVQPSDVLNFALNLEYLEATFYAYLTTGADLPSSLITGATGPVTMPPAIPAWQSNFIEDMVNEIYYDEMSHVADLQAALASAAVPRPALNLAGGGVATTGTYLQISRTFEDVGVTAYAGAAQYLSGTDLTYAAQILGVEGFHAGALRFAAILYGVAGGAAADAEDVIPNDEGSPAAARLGPGTNGGYFATASAANMTNGVFPGFAFTRTASQVLNIVLGAGGATGVTTGGYFPQGMNGNIKST
jgi:hypothetical protein